MIQQQLNGFFLNEVINGVLFLLLITLYLNSLMDQRGTKLQINRNFSAFVLCSTLYVGMMLIYFPVLQFYESHALLWGISFFRIVFALAAYAYIGGWLFCIIAKRDSVTKEERKFLLYMSHGILFLSTALVLFTHNTIIANIPIIIYYLLMEVIVLKNRAKLGREYTLLITLLILPELILTWQTWWNYTPANIYLIIIIAVIYNRMWLTERQKFLDTQILLAKREAELENARTRLVLSQIKPHFIYNTMGTITYLCGKDPKAAQSLSLNFTDYLRGNLMALDSNTLVPFTKEMEHVETYLKIEQVRFRDILKVKIDTPVNNFSLPVLTVEPLVENAVKHGICQKESGGTVIIRTEEDENAYFVIVEDDGAGFDTSAYKMESGDHVGLRSVQRRMKLLCNGSCEIKSTPGIGTTVILYVPKENANP